MRGALTLRAYATVVSFLCFTGVLVEADLLAALERENELSMFRERVTGVTWLSFLEGEGKITVFAPTNTAIEKFGRAKFMRLSGDDNDRPWLRNFFTQVKIFANDLPNDQSSFVRGGPKLFFSPYKDDPQRFFVNEALVIRRSQGSDNVIVYLIDTVPNFCTFENAPPTADEVLQNIDKFNELKGTVILGFRGRVNTFGLRDLFNSATPSTFFIPVGNSLPALTKEAIYAHVIPGRVLFTPQFGDDHFPTAAPPDNTPSRRIEVSLVNESIADVDGQRDHHDDQHHHSRHHNSLTSAYTLLVKSTMKGPPSKGSVLSRISQANLPVTNGVIHFIDSPLALVTKSIIDYIKDPKESKNRFNLFSDIVRQSPQFLRELQEGSQDRTLFVPTNQAVSVLPNDVWTQYKSNKTELLKLLQYHLVPSRVLTEESLASSGAETAVSAARVPLVLRRVHCHTGCYDKGRRSELVVECAGVNGSVVSADIAASNGVIHLVDRVLGAPSHSLGWKLQKEESLTRTQVVATKGLWNKVLDQPTSRFTLLAPDNKAWQRVSENYPSEYKRLVQLPGEAHVQAARVMDRHLAEAELTREDLTKMSEIKMRNGEFIQVERLGGDQIQLKWNGEVCNFVRNDLQATNGVIHIIDCVFMTRRDLIASSAEATSSGRVILTVFSILLAVFAART